MQRKEHLYCIVCDKHRAPMGLPIKDGVIYASNAYPSDAVFKDFCERCYQLFNMPEIRWSVSAAKQFVYTLDIKQADLYRNLKIGKIACAAFCVVLAIVAIWEMIR